MRKGNKGEQKNPEMKSNNQKNIGKKGMEKSITGKICTGKNSIEKSSVESSFGDGMDQTKANGKAGGTVTNAKARDNSSRLIFGDPILCAQFLRDYIDIPVFDKIQPEDIEDVTEKYIPLFIAERESDTVKKVRIGDNKSLFVISLIEHKTQVDYNVIMQLFRYMVCIWEDYEKEMNKLGRLSSSHKEFRYPPILPIVYYEGKGQWTAVTNLKERIYLSDVFAKYTPDFSYELIRLHDYSNEELMSHQDEISLIMMLNKLQSLADMEDIAQMDGLDNEIWRNTPEYLLNIIAKIVTVLLSRLNLPTEEIDEFVGRIKERNMPELFENFERVDFPAMRKKLREDLEREVREEVTEKVREEVREEVTEKVREEVTEKIREEVTEKIIEEVREKVIVEVRGEVREEVKEKVKEEIKEKVKEEIREKVKEEVREEVKDKMKAEVSTALLVNLVIRKLVKGKNTAEIADELEENEETIELICRCAAGYAPDYDTDAICRDVLCRKAGNVR